MWVFNLMVLFLLTLCHCNGQNEDANYCPAHLFHVGDFCIQLEKDKKGFSYSESRCKESGGAIVYIENQMMLDALISLLREDDSLWVDMSPDLQNQLYLSEAANHSEPGRNKRCFAISSTRANLADCEEDRGFICSFDSPKKHKPIRKRRDCYSRKKNKKYNNANNSTGNPPDFSKITPLTSESLKNMTLETAIQITAQYVNELQPKVQEIWTIEPLVTACEILNKLLNTSDFLSPEAQMNASQILADLAEQLLKIVDGSNNISAVNVTEVAPSLFNAFDGTMKCYMINYERLSSTQLDIILSDSLAAVEYLEIALWLVPDISVKSLNFSSTLSSLTLLRVDAADVSTEGISTTLPALSRVTFPPWYVLPNVTENSPLYVQLLALTINPFLHMSPTVIVGPITHILLSTEDSNMDVENLTENIEIVLYRNESANLEMDRKTLTKDKDFNVTVNVTSIKESMVLTLQPEVNINLTLYLGFQEQNNNSYLLQNMSLPDNGNYTLVLSPKHFKKGIGTYYIAVTVSNQSIWTERNSISLDIATFATQCVYWDYNLGNWINPGCHVGTQSSLAKTYCMCNHLTFFGSTFFVMPHVVDLRDSARLLANAAQNPVGLALLATLLGLFLIVVIWAWRKDKEDVKKVRVAALPDNSSEYHHRYAIKVCTGHRMGAGTTSQVLLTLYGSEGQSDPHLLIDTEKQVFHLGAVDVFLLKTRYLGELHSLRLWHSNSRSSPSWYVHRVNVTDLLAQRTWYFHCDSWLASDFADCQLDRIFPAVSRSNLMSLRYLLFSGTVDKLLKDHLWLSVWTRSPWNPFTRVQRICCCMSLLFLSLLINIMFWKGQGDGSTQTGQFPINEIKISVQSSFILAVVNIIIVQMFQLIQKQVTKVKLPSSKLRVAPSPYPPAKVDAKEQLIMDVGTLVDFLHKYVIQVLGETPIIPVASKSEPIFQNIESLSYLVQSYICVQGPNQENLTRKNVMTAHQCHFLHYLHQTLTKIQLQVSSLDLTYVNSPIHYIHATNVLYELRDQLQTQHFSNSPLPSSVTTSFPVPVAKKTLSSRLPKFLPYVCWFVLLAISSFSAYYMTLVSLDMTREKATSWLISMLLSLFQSLFVLPPVKAFIQTVFMFRVLRRSNMDDAAEEQQLHGILSLFASHPDWELSGCRDPQNPLYCAPANKAITSLKRQKLMETRLYRLILEIAVHVVFLVMTMIMAYANKSPNEYNLNNAISQSFSGTFLQSGNIEDFYSSTSNSLLPKLYSQYTGFITDGNCFLLGSPRIRQLRRAFESANGQSQYNKEETGNYKAGWVPLGKNDTPDCEWKYYTEKELVGYPIWGQLGWYSGGGFVVELGKNISYASSTLTWLQTNQWLDTYTKAVFVEFNVYNANVQLFCLVTFLMETSAIGNFFTSVDLQIIKLSQPTTDIFSLQFISYIVFLIIVLYNIIQQGLLMKKQKWSYFSKIKNLLDLSIIMISLCNTGLYIKLVLLRQRDIDRYQQDRTGFVSFYETAIVESIHDYSIAFLVSLMTAKLWSLLSLNPNLHLITVTLRKAWDEISCFLIAIVIVIVAYSITCNLLYGWSIYSYRTFFDSAVTIFSLLIGIFNYDEVLDLNPIIGSLLITTYVIFLVFMLVNIFLSVILTIFSQERRCPTSYKDKEVVDLLLLKLSGLFVVGKKTKRSEDAKNEKKLM